MKLILALALAACSTPTRTNIVEIPPAPPACPPNTPAALAPAPDAELAFVLDAQGTQRYSCTASGWSAAIPAATLFSGGIETVQHFAGPSWLAVTDSSSVTATKHAAATVDPASIPWLLLDVASHGGLKGILTPITQIQRLSTVGGIQPPNASCDAAHVGLEVDVLYTATYWFYRQATTGAVHQRCGA